MAFSDIAIGIVASVIIAVITIIITGQQNNKTLEHISTELKGDFDSTINVIKEDGKQTRLSIDKTANRTLDVIEKSTKSTLEVIEKSHSTIKDELKELERARNL